MEVVKRTKTEEEEHVIKPQAATPAVDTSSWPLLLKNYEKRKGTPARDAVSPCHWGQAPPWEPSDSY